MQVSINFCGGCNPRIDRIATAEKIKHQLEVWGIAVCYNDLNADFVVYINGCKVSCACRRVPANRGCVIIAGCNLNALDVAEADLSQLAVEKVRDYLGKLERSI